MIVILAAIIWFVVLLIAFARRHTNDAWRDVLAIGVIGITTAGFFWRLLAGQVWMPAGGGDLAQFLYPTYSFAASQWTRGGMPLWNPYLFSGAPFVGDIQSGIFYPLNLLTFFISHPFTFRDMEFLSVLHFLIAGTGMYLFLRFGRWTSPNSKLRISIFASLAGAIAFEFSDLFITHFGNLNLIAVIAWMPLILLFYRRATTDRSPGFGAISGVLLAAAFLAGHIQLFLFIIIALGLFTIYHIIDHQPPSMDDQNPNAVNHQRSFVIPVLVFILVGVVALGLSAPLLLPSLEMSQNTVRSSYSYEQAAQFSLPPAELIGMFVPGFFGRVATNTWGPWSRVEVGYIGILTLLLAFLAIILRRDSSTRFFGALALIGLAFALGGYSILHGWLYQLFPGFGQLRVPARFIVLMDFALATLTAFGFDALMHALPRASEVIFKRIVRAAPWVLLLVALPAGTLAYSNLILGQGQDAVLFARIASATNALAFFILLFALSLGLIVARGARFFRPTAWAILALALIFFDLFSLGAYIDASTDDPSRVFDHPDAVAFFNSDAGFYRVDPRETGVDNSWPPDTSILHGLFDINGDNPLVLGDFDRYWQSLGSRSSPLYDLLNVKYVIVAKDAPLDFNKFKLASDREPTFNIFENTRVLPRAFIVNDVQLVSDHAAAMVAIHAPEFNPRQTVVLETADHLPPTFANSAAITGQPSAVAINGYAPNEILLDVESANPGVLVLSEVYYPGWRAWVDDREAQILRADYVFRAVELPAGTHRVRFAYEPAPFKIGEGWFAVTAIALTGWCIWTRRRR